MKLTREAIVEAVHQAQGLPTFPEVALHLEQELRRPDASFHRVQAIIEQDPALVASILRVANSAVYPRTGGRTAAIGEALVRLGLSELKRLAVTSAVFERFRGFGSIDERRFWVHSLSVALASRAVARFAEAAVSEAVQDVAFTAGLLHDLGALVLHHLFPDACDALLVELEERGGLACDLEREHWGIDHGEAGALLAARWSLPEAMTEVIRFHHRPWLSSPEHRVLVQLVHMANFICTNQGYGRREGGFPDSFDHGAWESLGLPLARVPDIIETVRIEGEQSVVFAGELSPPSRGAVGPRSARTPISGRGPTTQRHPSSKRWRDR